MDSSHPEFQEQRSLHAARVVRDKFAFMKHYDEAAKMVFAGSSKDEVIDALAPWGCDATQSNGTQAGALQAVRLLKLEESK